MEDIKDRRAVVDTQTGEVVTTMQDDDRILRGKSIEYLKSKKLERPNQQFVKIFSDSAYHMSMSENFGVETRVLFRLIPQIRYGNGVVANEYGIPMGVGEIKRLCDDMSSRAVERALVDLVKMNLFRKIMSGNRASFYANPYVFMRGTKVDDSLKKMFEGKEGVLPINKKKGDSVDKEKQK